MEKEDGKTHSIEEELKFLDNLKKELLIFGDEELDGMEDAQISVLRRIKKLRRISSFTYLEGRK